MAEASTRITHSFLGVPCEIRMLIYDKLVGDRVFWVDFPQDGSLHYRVLGSPAILRVSKQVRDEAQRAVKVRTLRVNKFKLSDAKLLLRIPSIVSRWAPTIKNLLIGYRQFEFDALLGRGDGVRPDRLLTGLKHVLGHLPNLVTVTITCDDLPFQRDQELENQASKFSQDLLTSLPHFNRIQVQMRRKKTWAALSAAGEAEIKLFKMQPYLQPTVSAISQDSTAKQAPGSSGRKVLLDVIKISDISSKTEKWLTINEVNQ